jgi:hypothetical protein
MTPPQVLLRDTEAVLRRAIQDFGRPATSANATEFYQLRLQAAIFQYDICRQIVGLWVFEPKGFGVNLVLKDIVHKLYEYDFALSKRLIGRVLGLATARGIQLDRKMFKEERAKWRKEFARLQAWSQVRNAAGGHYGADIRQQFELLQQLEREEVMAVAIAFMNFNGKVIVTLAAVGSGKRAA